MRIATLGIMLVSSLAMISCANVYERFHLQQTSKFTVTDPDSKEIGGEAKSREVSWTNYYRVTVNANTQLSASQYAAGWYDKAAVDALFGELKGPGRKVSVDSVNLIGYEKKVDGKTVASGNDKDKGSDEKKVRTMNVGDGELKSGSTSLDDKTLVIFLSTNSSALVSQIRAFTKSAQIQNNLVAMLLGPDFERLEEEKLTAEMQDATAASEGQRLDAEVKALTEAKNAGNIKKADIKKALVASLKLLAQSSRQPDGSSVITDADQAKKWLEDHPGAFFFRKGD